MHYQMGYVNILYHTASTFEIYNHVDSVWCHGNAINIKGWNPADLINWECIRLRGADKSSILDFLVHIRENWQVHTAQTFEISGHGTFVWCHCNPINIKEWNLINLAYQERVWLRGSDVTSLLGLFGVCPCKTGKTWQTLHLNKWSWGFCVMTL